MYLPGSSDFRAFGKGLSLIAYVLFVAWWWYPLLIVWWVTILVIRFIVWVVEEVNYLGHLKDRSR